MSLRQRLSEQLTGWAYQLGWNLIRRVPQSWARRVFAAVAEVAWRRQGPKVQVLESNLRHVLSWTQGSPDVDGQELRALSRVAMRSYARYWLEVFRLPEIPLPRIVSGMHIAPEEEAALFATLRSGRGVILALPHMGNFEQAGAWVVGAGAGTFTTVAERLKPESVYEAFLRFRQGLGMEVLPLTGGAEPVRRAGPAAAGRRPGLPGQRPRPEGKRRRGARCSASRPGSPPPPRWRCTPAPR